MSKPSLTAAFVKNVRYQGRNPPVPERYNDGAGTGLYLNVMPSHSKQFLQRLKVAGKRRDYGLGGYSTGGENSLGISLAKAREIALDNWLAARRGEVPACEAKRQARLAERQARKAGSGSLDAATLATIPGGPTFEAAFLTVLAARAPSWKPSVRVSSERSWKQGLRDYLGALARVPVAAVTAADIRRCIEPAWTSKPKTAEKQLRRIGLVLRWAIAEGLRDADPTPAVRSALPRFKAAPRHFKALPPDQIPGLLARVRESDAPRDARLAFELMALTALRTNEVRLADWSEIDLEAALWVIPAERMKYSERGDHRVPLSPQAVEVLRAVGPAREAGKVFRAPRGGALGDDAFRDLLRDLGVTECSPHGLRSSFRDHCALNGVDRLTAEAALAHARGGKTEQAYFRVDLFAQRRAVMVAWADFVCGAA